MGEASLVRICPLNGEHCDSPIECDIEDTCNQPENLEPDDSSYIIAEIPYCNNEDSIGE